MAIQPLPSDEQASVLLSSYTRRARNGTPSLKKKREGPLSGAPDEERAYKRDPVLRRSGGATIPLGSPLPATSCSRPGSIERATRSLLGLAPRGACRAAAVTRRAGELLPHRFTLTDIRRRSVFCGAFPGSPPVGVTHRAALWSPDFPRHRYRWCRGRPACSPFLVYPCLEDG